MASLKKIRKPAAWMILPSVALAVFLALTLSDFYFFYRAGPAADDRTVIIPSGATLKSAAALLERHGVLEVKAAFYWTARLSGAAGDLQAGEFLIPAGASQSEILNILLTGKTVLHKITFPEGLTSAQVAALLLEEEKLTGEIKELPGEGTLLPETYLFERGDSRSDILRRMAENRDRLLEDLWADYDFSLPFMSIGEAVILASMVEEETGIAEERTLIAAVFLNRLKRGMRLQSDPTVIYGLTGGVPLGRPILLSELERDTPYNTYIHTGLPPGPIANPGRAALEAVFNPAHSDALYFVADGAGGHVFADTLDQHNKNVRKWRRFQREGSSN